MNLRWLKWVRVAVAVLVLSGLTLAFLNFRHLLPRGVTSFLTSLQFIPSVIALPHTLSLGAIIVLAITLFSGRLYCSAICPLGILQDLIGHMSTLFRRRPSFLRYAPAKTWLRHLFFWGTLVTIPLGGAGLAVAWLDPYSNFGRIISILVRPVALRLNNALVAPWNTLNHAEIALAPIALLIGVGAFLIVITVMTVWRGRLYCNTVCPVGTLLGFLSKHSYLKLKINADACGKCAECLKECKAQCIDLKAGTVDASRCVACYNCLTACDRAAMRLEPSWSFERATATPGNGTFDAGRRQFLLTSAGGALIAGASVLPDIARADDDNEKKERKRKHGGKEHGESRKYSHVITPPLAGDTETFLAHCTACQLCISSCTTGVLQPALFDYGPFHLLKPHMDYNRSFCNYTCHRCTEVCPTSALPRLPITQKQITRIGTAHFNKDHCIVYLKHTDCAACSEHCPTKAANMVPFENGLVIPEVDETLCIGCGACEFACPAEEKAIRVHGAPQDKLARRPSDEKMIQPTTPKEGFPF